jgi:glycosyltransferase involved in cell wall biosynthesis
VPENLKVLLLHNIMAPYRFPLFRALAGRPGIDLTVWFMSRSAKNRRWAAAKDGREQLGFNYSVLPAIELRHFTRDLFTYIVNPTFPGMYARHRYDVLIAAGWLDFACQVGFTFSKLMRRKFILWSESTPNELSWRRTVAVPLVKTMVSGADACIAVGSRSKQYLEMLGARPPDIFTAYSTVDIAHFELVSSRARLTRDQRKEALGIKRRQVVLYCGQFIERKGIRDLVDAFAIVKREFEDVALLLVGYGPLQADLEWRVRELGLADVHFVGHAEVDEIPALYALGDIFVLPSTEETWGLVVNEAMACGLPVVVTDAVGSGPDLVEQGANGFVVQARNVEALANRVGELLRGPSLIAAFSRRSSELIHRFTPESAADQFAEAIHHTARTGTIRPPRRSRLPQARFR